MKSKIVSALAFGLILTVLGSIASDAADARVGGVAVRSLLSGVLLLIVVLFARYGRTRSGSAVSLRNKVKDYSRLKPLYLVLAAVGTASHFFLSQPDWLRSSVLVAGCLLAAFFTPEKIDDERVQHLKLKATRAAFAAAFVLVFLYTWTFRGRERTDYFPSAFDMIIVTMLMALGFFHYWRWQDGRADPSS